jgi:acetyl-CoA acetyltransferase
LPSITEQVVIVGIGETPIGKLLGLSPVEIQALAVREALRYCGITVRDIDGMVALGPYAIPNTGFVTTLAEYVGATLSYCATIDAGGTVTSMLMLQQAIWAIASGHCDVVVCSSGENLLTGRPKGRHGAVIQNLVGGEEFEEPFGIPNMVSQYALVAKRYMHEFGTTEEDMGAVAVAARSHAVLNDNAVKRSPLTLAEHQSSRMISTPFRLLDCSIPADGAGAIVLTSLKTAQRLGLPGVRVRSMATRLTHNTIIGLPDLDRLSLREASRAAFSAASVSPADIDVSCLHDAFTISVIMMLEEFEFCARGEAGRYIRDGKATLGGRCPVNPHGGLLSQGHFGGFLHPVELVRQLLGKAGKRQVDGARLGFLGGGGGLFSPIGAMVLEAPGR